MCTCTIHLLSIQQYMDPIEGRCQLQMSTVTNREEYLCAMNVQESNAALNQSPE